MVAGLIVDIAPVMRTSGGTRVSDDKDLGGAARGEHTYSVACRLNLICAARGFGTFDVDDHDIMLICKLTRSRESGADEEQSAQGAEHDVCPVADERDKELAAVAEPCRASCRTQVPDPGT